MVPERFTLLYEELDATTSTAAKEAALTRYFQEADPADAAWALFFLIGGKLPRAVPTPLLREWAGAAAKLPVWLVAECHDQVGDLAETLSLLIPEPAQPVELPLHRLVEERLKPLKKLPEPARRAAVEATWRELSSRQRFLFHKLMGGAFRVGVARALVSRALAKVAGLPPAVMAHRLMGEGQPTAEQFRRLLDPSVTADHGDPGRPYPFLLAHPLPGPVEELGAAADWQVEWKWDGIRAQLLRRAGSVLLWSRGEELLSDRFPEIVQAASLLPDGTVLDGEVLAWRDGGPMPFAQLQRRIGRKKLDAKVLAEAPVCFLAYDLLEEQGADVRRLPLAERRPRLERLLADPALVRLRLSPLAAAAGWPEVHAAHAAARKRGVEGLMLKRRAAAYGVGRVTGDWWKWKLPPYTVDAVLIYAQGGRGRRANLFTDYTFGVWQGDELVPVAKAYSGLTNEEIQEVDRYIRANTLDRFGPVRVVKPAWVFELAFEGIQESKRHKAGLALRFPRISRWRKDKGIAEADHLASLQKLLAESIREGSPAPVPRAAGLPWAPAAG